MSCTPGMWGCDGGDPYYAWKYTQTSGILIIFTEISKGNSLLDIHSTMIVIMQS